MISNPKKKNHPNLKIKKKSFLVKQKETHTQSATPRKSKEKKRGGNVAEQTIRKKNKNKAPHLEIKRKKYIKNKKATLLRKT